MCTCAPDCLRVFMWKLNSVYKNETAAAAAARARVYLGFCVCLVLHLKWFLQTTLSECLGGLKYYFFFLSIYRTNNAATRQPVGRDFTAVKSDTAKPLR